MGEITIPFLENIRLKGLETVNVVHVLNTIKTTNCNSALHSFFSAIRWSLYNNISSESKGNDIAFLFSSNYRSRKDHFIRFQKVVSLFTNVTVFTPKTSFCFKNIRYFRHFIEFFLAFKKKFNYSLAAFYALSLYLTYIEAKYILEVLEKNNIKKLVVFCDMHPVDNLVVQLCKNKSIRTATLQHGHYLHNSPAFKYSHSDIFIGFGAYACNIAKNSGFDAARFKVAGMMDLINERITERMVLTEKNIFAVILCGYDKEEDLVLLHITEFLSDEGYKRLIKFHPGSDMTQYPYKWKAEDILIVNQKTVGDIMFETDFSVISGGSTAFLESVIKLFPVFLFDYHTKRYDGLNCLRFSNSQELRNILQTLKSAPDVIEKSLKVTRKEISEIDEVAQKYIEVINEL